MRNIVATVVFAAMAMVGGSAAAHKVNPNDNKICTMGCKNGSTRVGSCSNGWTTEGCQAAGDTFCKDKGGLAAGYPKLSRGKGGKGGKLDVAYQVTGNVFGVVKGKGKGKGKGVGTSKPKATKPE